MLYYEERVSKMDSGERAHMNIPYISSCQSTHTDTEVVLYELLLTQKLVFCCESYKDSWIKKNI